VSSSFAEKHNTKLSISYLYVKEGWEKHSTLDRLFGHGFEIKKKRIPARESFANFKKTFQVQEMPS